jgi:hypothetical protein
MRMIIRLLKHCKVNIENGVVCLTKNIVNKKNVGRKNKGITKKKVVVK